MYGLFTTASHRNVWRVRVLLDTEIDNRIHSETRLGKEISSHPETSRPALGLNQPSIQRYRGSFPGAKWPGREIGYSSSSGTVKLHLLLPLHVFTTDGQQFL